jgi:hypothetical protein
MEILKKLIQSLREVIRAEWESLRRGLEVPHKDRERDRLESSHAIRDALLIR